MDTDSSDGDDELPELELGRKLPGKRSKESEPQGKKSSKKDPVIVVGDEPVSRKSSQKKSAIVAGDEPSTSSGWTAGSQSRFVETMSYKWIVYSMYKQVLID